MPDCPHLLGPPVGLITEAIHVFLRAHCVECARPLSSPLLRHSLCGGAYMAAAVWFHGGRVVIHQALSRFDWSPSDSEGLLSIEDDACSLCETDYVGGWTTRNRACRSLTNTSLSLSRTLSPSLFFALSLSLSFSQM